MIERLRSLIFALVTAKARTPCLAQLRVYFGAKRVVNALAGIFSKNPVPA